MELLKINQFYAEKARKAKKKKNEWNYMMSLIYFKIIIQTL